VAGDRYSLVGEYVGNKIEVSHRCRDTGELFMGRPDNLLRGYGCPCCVTQRKREGAHWKLSDEDVHKRIQEVWGDEVKWVEGEYLNNRSVLTFKHPCSRRWQTTASKIINGKQGCPTCRLSNLPQHQPMDVDEYQDRALERGFELVGEYLGQTRKTLHRHVACELVKDWRPSDIMKSTNSSNSGCPQCSVGSYKSHKAGWLYLITFPTLNAMKYGISNRPWSRIEEIGNTCGATPTVIKKWKFADGSIPQQI
jgi:hypothetical protein